MSGSQMNPDEAADEATDETPSEGSGRPPVMWPPTRSSGDLLFVSGQISLDDDGNLVGRADWDAQAKQCLRRIERELRAHGASMEDVVRLNSFLVDAAGYPAYAQARTELFPGLHAAGTSVVVAGLLVEGALLEVEATAVRPGSEPDHAGSSGREPGRADR
jgi:2-iminobutanoate/2-iminopropanoate deaminase